MYDGEDVCVCDNTALNEIFCLGVAKLLHILPNTLWDCVFIMIIISFPMVGGYVLGICINVCYIVTGGGIMEYDKIRS